MTGIVPVNSPVRGRLPRYKKLAGAVNWVFNRYTPWFNDTALEAKTLIAIYQPNDVNPTFRRFRAPKTCECITLYASKKFYDLVDPKELVEFTADAMIYAVLALNSRENRMAAEFMNNLALAVQEQEKEMSGYDIPTAAPPRFADYRRPENLIEDTFLSPSSNDYFLYP